MTINISGHLMDLSIPKVMGILNVTPDSFYSDSRTFDEESIRDRVKEMISEGVDIIDIGGYSTRPGYEEVSDEEEFRRLNLGCKIVKECSKNIPISIDTFRASVAEKIISLWNVPIVNDISGGTDPDLFRVVSKYQRVYVLTHNIKEQKVYKDITAEVITDLSKKINELHRLGVNDVIIDPGFGFGKTTEENFKLLNELNEVAKMDLPILVGISRKSMIYKTLDCNPKESLTGTIVLNTIALEKGANILRVHDVKAAKETIILYKKLRGLSL